MAQSTLQNTSFKEEEDTRSIKIRQGYQPLSAYLQLLSNTTTTYFPDSHIEVFDDLFRSFLHEDNFALCLQALQLIFQKIQYYALEKANCKISFNIGIILDYFLTKFKPSLTDEHLKSLYSIISSLIANEPLKLHTLKDTDYVIAVVYFKHYVPALYQQEKSEILLRLLQSNENIDECVKFLTGLYSNDDLNALMNFQNRSLVLVRNTKLLTEDYIRKTIDILTDRVYRDDWLTIFANKMLANLIVPIVAAKQQNDLEIEIDDCVLLDWLLLFSERAFGQKLRPDKWETVNDEDFALTWEYVKKFGSTKQRKNFQKYLIENGFEFHMNDPFTGACFKNVLN